MHGEDVGRRSAKYKYMGVPVFNNSVFDAYIPMHFPRIHKIYDVKIIDYLSSTER